MSPTLTCLALSLLGVDLGYRPVSNGGADFVIHIHPATLQALRPGEPIEIAVPREALGLRPSHFSITPENAKLPGEVSVVSLLPPATAPVVAASPLMSAAAAAPIPSPYTPPAGETIRVGPPSSSTSPQSSGGQVWPPSPSAPPQSTVAHVWPLLTGANPAPSRASATAADAKMMGLTPVDGNSNSAQIDRPWLGMCLFVIALLASNAYVGWLFWDARQRYHGLLTRTFSFGQQPAEA